jgi:AI-2 transport protein TqsA
VTAEPTPVPERGQPTANRFAGVTPLRSSLFTAVAVGLLLFLTGWLAPVVAPLGLGLFVAALATPLFGWLLGRGLSAPVALGVTVGLVVVIGGLLVLLAVVSVRSLSDSLVVYAAEIDARTADSAIAGFPSAIRDLVTPEDLTAVLRATIGIIANVGTTVVFAVVVAALLLLDGPRLAGLVAAGTGAQNPVFREGPEVVRSAVTYFVVRIRVNAVTAIGLLAAMLLLGIDDPVLWAVGAFFLSFVPYLGLVVALIPPTILAFAESGIGAAVAIAVAGIVLNVVAENVLEPTLAGRALKLPTWLVFVSFFFWVWLIGPVGALLSMPLTVLTVLVLQGSPGTSWLAAFLRRA